MSHPFRVALPVLAAATAIALTASVSPAVADDADKTPEPAVTVTAPVNTRAAAEAAADETPVDSDKIPAGAVVVSVIRPQHEQSGHRVEGDAVAALTCTSDGKPVAMADFTAVNVLDSTETRQADSLPFGEEEVVAWMIEDLPAGTTCEVKLTNNTTADRTVALVNEEPQKEAASYKVSEGGSLAYVMLNTIKVQVFTWLFKGEPAGPVTFRTWCGTPGSDDFVPRSEFSITPALGEFTGVEFEMVAGPRCYIRMMPNKKYDTLVVERDLLPAEAKLRPGSATADGKAGPKEEAYQMSLFDDDKDNVEEWVFQLLRPNATGPAHGRPIGDNVKPEAPEATTSPVADGGRPLADTGVRA